MDNLPSKDVEGRADGSYTLVRRPKRHAPHGARDMAPPIRRQSRRRMSRLGLREPRRSFLRPPRKNTQHPRNSLQEPSANAACRIEPRARHESHHSGAGVECSDNAARKQVPLAPAMWKKLS
jgi:hypothetical protein